MKTDVKKKTTGLFVALALLCAGAASAGEAWQQCASLSDDTSRLACYDDWAGRKKAAETPVPTPPNRAETRIVTPLPELAETGQGIGDGCYSSAYSTLSRWWELEPGSDCGIFRFRGYRPLSLFVAVSDSVNQQPSSSAKGRTASERDSYKTTELRGQLSVRTKLAADLLTQGNPEGRDSLWFAYTQQFYWQLFDGGNSRPFRTTDHEPELIYIHPFSRELPGGWRLRYTGLGLVHQSNGQSLPLSRSWNRLYLMAGAELGENWLMHARVWKRMSESRGNDDNPGIGNLIGRGEFKLAWTANDLHSVALTLRHSLRREGNGSARLEWLRTIGSGYSGGKSNLRLHAQLFSGYGDSLIDFNQRRTVFSIGLSLIDF